MLALGIVIISKVCQVSNPNDLVHYLFSILGPKIQFSNLSSEFWIIVSRIYNGSSSGFWFWFFDSGFEIYNRSVLVHQWNTCYYIEIFHFGNSKRPIEMVSNFLQSWLLSKMPYIKSQQLSFCIAYYYKSLPGWVSEVWDYIKTSKKKIQFG